MLKLLLPLLSLLPLLMLPSNLLLKWVATAMTLITLFMLTTLTILSPTSEIFSIMPNITLDMMSVSLMLLTLWISSLMIMVSIPSILLTKKAPTMFSAMILMLTAALIITFSSSNFIIFYIFFEASLLPTLMLILAWGYQPERLQASMYLMLYTVTASLPLLMTLLFFFSSSKTLSFFQFMWILPEMSHSLITIMWLMAIIAFLVKMPLYFFHLWLPKAHVEAPIAGSMILASVLLKLGSYGILRLISVTPSLPLTLFPLLSTAALLGACITSLICLRQSDLKALIAYSSIGHMGILTAGLMSSSHWGWTGTLSMMLAHGLCSSAMFSLANTSYSNTNTRSMLLTKGLMSIYPNLTTWWFLFSAANMAAPPMISLYSEILLMASTLAKASFSSLLLAPLGFLAAAYSLHLYTNSQHGSLPSFSNPMKPISYSTYPPLLLHLFPILLFISNLGPISHWV